MLNKVPEVTLFFWIIKILCTTVGETAADYLNETLGFGLTNTTYVTGALLAVLLLAQFRLRKYVPAVYWSVVVVISVFGTLITDNMTDAHNVPLTTTTPIFAVILASSSPSGTPSNARCRCTRSSRPAARRSTGWRSSSPSRSAPPRATSAPRSSTSATPSRSRSSAASSPSSRSRATSCTPTRSSRSGWPTSSPARSAPRSATRCPRPATSTAASGSAPPTPATSSSPRSSRSSSTSSVTRKDQTPPELIARELGT